RAAVMFSAITGAAAAAAVDLLFLAVLLAAVAREIVSGRNIRNLKVLAVLAVLFMGNAISHVELLFSTHAGHGLRLGLAAMLMLIMLLGGRIIPSFTGNGLVRRVPGRLPRPFDRLDLVTLVIAGAALAIWVIAPEAPLTAGAAIAAAVAHVWRLGRWAGERTGAEPLVLILHVAYAFVPAGFALLALGILRPAVLQPSAP